MKKIIIMLFIMAFGAFASPLLADPTSAGYTFTKDYGAKKNVNVNDRAAGGVVLGATFEKVKILQRDSLMCSLTKNNTYHREIEKQSGQKLNNIASTNVTIAVVRYPRGEVGV